MTRDELSVHAQSLQLCLTLHDPMDCSLPDSSVHRILQARILEWVAISFSSMYALVNSICFPLSDLLPSVRYTLGSSALLELTQIRSFHG